MSVVVLRPDCWGGVAQMVKHRISNGLPIRLVYRTIYVVLTTFVAGAQLPTSVSSGYRSILLVLIGVAQLFALFPGWMPQQVGVCSSCVILANPLPQEELNLSLGDRACAFSWRFSFLNANLKP